MRITKHLKALMLLSMTLMLCSPMAVFASTAKFYTNKGVAIESVDITANSKFPGRIHTHDNCFLGWSTKKKQTKNPEFLEGESIPQKDAKYYEVYSKISAEPKVTIKESIKYKKVYLLGDSRMARPNLQFGNTLKKTSIIAKGGQGYAWLTQKSGAYNQLIQALKKDQKTTKKAIVFCFGVNDMQNVSKYISFYKNKAAELKSYNCDLYAASINPVAPTQRNYFKRLTDPTYNERRKLHQILNFNTKIQTKLKGLYTYIDVRSYLLKNGFCYDPRDFDVPDGLHYSIKTNKKIFNYIFKSIDK